LENDMTEARHADRQIAVAGDWAIATDGRQWILQQVRKNGYGRAVSFVRTSKDKLRRCCCDNGVPPSAIEPLLASLPDFFPGWSAEAEAFADGYSRFRAGRAPAPPRFGQKTLSPASAAPPMRLAA
jgi:hypothetical protein